MKLKYEFIGNKYNNIELNESQKNMLNYYIMANILKYIMQVMLDGFRNATLEDPNIMNNTAAQLQYLRITTCNKIFPEILNKLVVEYNVSINSEEDVKNLNIPDDIISNINVIFMDIVKNNCDLLNVVAEDLVDLLNNEPGIALLNKFDGAPKVFQAPHFQMR